MSQEIATVPSVRGELSLTQFWGGEADGVCVQLTQVNVKRSPDDKMIQYVQLSLDEAESLAHALTYWVEQRRSKFQS